MTAIPNELQYRTHAIRTDGIEEYVNKVAIAR